MARKRQSHNNFLTELIFATCDHRLVDFFAGPAINHWDKWPVVGDDVEFYGNQTGEMIQPQKISSLCTFAEESLRLDVWKPQKSLQHLEFKLLRRRIFPAPNVAIAMQPIFFPSRIFEEDSREGTNGKISHGALVFGWIQNWPPRGRSPCCKLASLPYTVNYKSEKKRIEVFFVKMPTEYCLAIFNWHSASWSLCFGCMCVVFFGCCPI